MTFLPFSTVLVIFQAPTSGSKVGFGVRKSRDVDKELVRDRKDHDSHRRDRILRIFLRAEIGQFSPHLGAIS